MAETFPRWGLPEVNFIEINPEKIKAEIITGYEQASGRTLAVGDPVRLFLLSIAAVIIQQRQAINIAGQQNLLTYAQGEKLDAIGVLVLCERLKSSPAITTLQFKLVEALANDYTIPAGFEVTNSIVTFATDKELIIRAGELYGEVEATCTENGKAGNDYLPGQIVTIVKPLPYLEKATNLSITSGGADDETDEDYAERIRIATNSFSVAGPEKAYIYHAFSVNPAIIDVSVYSPEPGEVEIYPLLTDGELPTDDVLEQVETYLSSDNIRPLTDHVTAKTPAVKEFAINLDYWINKQDVMKAETIKEAVTAAVDEFKLWQQTKIGRDITPDLLISKVMAAGAARVDFSTLSPAQWVELSPFEVAQCSGVTITYKGTKDD